MADKKEKTYTAEEIPATLEELLLHE